MTQTHLLLYKIYRILLMKACQRQRNAYWPFEFYEEGKSQLDDDRESVSDGSR